MNCAQSSCQLTPGVPLSATFQSLQATSYSLWKSESINEALNEAGDQRRVLLVGVDVAVQVSENAWNGPDPDNCDKIIGRKTYLSADDDWDSFIHTHKNSHLHAKGV